MRAATVVLATLAGCAAAKTSALSAMRSILQTFPPDPPGIAPWAGPYFNTPDFHRGIDWPELCFYLEELGSLADLLKNATYECDIENTIYWVYDKGPWRVSGLLRHLELVWPTNFELTADIVVCRAWLLCARPRLFGPHGQTSPHR
jgi:hypothetical protein